MPSYSLITFGCQMNQHDSERMEEVLKGAGYVPSAGVESADLVLLNTCSVREKAEQKLRSEVGRLGVLKRRRPELMIGVAGCVAQQEGERLLRKMPQIDLLIGPDHIADLPAVLRELEGGAPPQVLARFDVAAPRFLSAQPGVLGRQAVSSFVTVMKGCDERCSFCIVPTTRGPERYRPAAQILAECQALVAAGARELTLLGQTVDSYLDPERSLAQAPADVPLIEAARSRRGAGKSSDISEFPALLRAIAEATQGLVRLRYTSPHPRHLTPQLIAAHRDLPVLARHVHMPVQSGSDAVLRRMIRRYSIEEYLERTGRLRAEVPGLTLSTDIIVGFPGETDADFQATLRLIEQVGFIGVFGFKYSERPGTAALKLGDDVPEGVKAERLTALFELSERLQRAHLSSLVGSVVKVLVEGPGKTGGYSGRSERNEIVHLGSSVDLTGELCDVTVVEAYKHSLMGEPVIASLRAARPLPFGASAAQGTPIEASAQGSAGGSLSGSAQRDAGSASGGAITAPRGRVSLPLVRARS